MSDDPIPLTPLAFASARQEMVAYVNAPQAFAERPRCPRCHLETSDGEIKLEQGQPPILTYGTCGHRFVPNIQQVSVLYGWESWHHVPCERCGALHPRYCPDCPGGPPCADHVCSDA